MIDYRERMQENRSADADAEADYDYNFCTGILSAAADREPSGYSEDWAHEIILAARNAGRKEMEIYKHRYLAVISRLDYCNEKLTEDYINWVNFEMLPTDAEVDSIISKTNPNFDPRLP